MILYVGFHQSKLLQGKDVHWIIRMMEANVHNSAKIIVNAITTPFNLHLCSNDLRAQQLYSLEKNKRYQP